MITQRAFILFTLLLLVGCSNNAITHYTENTPKLVPEEFFNGNLIATGVVKNRSGKVTRWFTADIKAYWQDGIGTLEEDFVFNDGEKQRRVWKLIPSASSTKGVTRYTGTAGDVIGKAPIRVAGNAMFLKYVLRVPFKDSTLDVTVDDKMYLTHENYIMNESILYKFGFRVGAIALTIHKISDEETSN